MPISIHRVLLIIFSLFTAVVLLGIPRVTASAKESAKILHPSLSWKGNSFQVKKQVRGFGSIYQQKITEQILNVIDGYRTGLKERDKIKIAQSIRKQSQIYGYDPLFLTAVIITESSFRNWAKSHVGALGLMQIRPRTGKALAREIKISWRGKDTLYDPVKNIALGAYYLNKLLNRFGNLDTALEAYNHGPTRMSRFLRRGKQPVRYSQKVFTIYNDIRFTKPDLEPTLVAYSPGNPQRNRMFASGPLLSSGHFIRTYRGDNLWRLARRLGFDHKEATKVAVALWIDNQDAFINGNMHGIMAGKILNLDNLEYRLATLNPDTVKKIVQSQWKKWLRGETREVPATVAKAESSAKPKTERKIETPADQSHLAKTHESILPGDSLWKVSQRLGFDSKDATRVAVALWLDNMDAFINANIHGIKAGESLSLENLNQRLETLDYKTASRIVKNQWQEWESA